MYNIAKVAKGEILLFFNEVFDALCKVRLLVFDFAGTLTMLQLAADSELSVKNGAELLDRLVKDIVSESAATYVSVLDTLEDRIDDESNATAPTSDPYPDLPTAFSLARFIPLLKERIFVLNPFARTFLVSWVTLLDTIPDLELISYLPDFLGGLFKFLSDPNRDVHIATQGALDRFLNEIKRISKIKRGMAESRRSGSRVRLKRLESSQSVSLASSPSLGDEERTENVIENDDPEEMESTDEEYVPGQDVNIDYSKLVNVCVNELDAGSGMLQVIVVYDVC